MREYVLTLACLAALVSVTVNAQEISSADARVLKAVKELQATKPNEAISLLESSLKKRNSLPLQYELGLLLASQSNDIAATKVFTAVFEKNPDYPGVGRNLAILLMKAENYDEAIRVLTTLSKKRDLGAELNLLLGKAYSVRGKHLSALQCFRSALPAYPAQIDLRLKIADTLYRLERYTEAASAATAVIRDNATSAPAWMIKGNCMLKTGQPVKAIDHFEAARLLDNTLNKKILPLLGNLYLSQNLPNQAAACLTEAGAATKDQQLALARAFYNDDDTARCSTIINSLLAERPAPPEARLLSALVSYKSGQSADAQKALKLFVTDHPMNGEALVTLADIAAQKKDYSKAISWYKAARYSDRWKRYAMESELDLYLQISDKESAKRLLSELKTVFPSPQWDQLDSQLNAH